MSSELKKRIFTGLLGSAALVLLLTYGGWLPVFFLVSLLSLGLLHEYGLMVFSMSDQVEKRYCLLFTSWFISCVNLLLPQNEYSVLVTVFLVLFSYYLWTARRHEGVQLPTHLKELAFSVFGIVYLAFFPLFFRKIYELSNGVEWILLFLFVNWAGDTGAYFVGKWFGKVKLYPQISPKKTREGAWGGLATSLVVAGIIKLTFFKEASWIVVLFIPVIVGATAQVGDLCESFVKRAFDKKDSGSVLPGHGGLLDRFDGVVFSLPVMYACIKVLT